MLKIAPPILLTLLGCTSETETESCEGSTLTVSGTVYDLSGSPFVGANILARSTDFEDGPDEEARTKARSGTADVTTISDASGAYSLTIGVGEWSVWAWMESYEDTGYGGGFGCESEVLQLTASGCSDVAQDFTLDDCYYDD